MSTAVALVTGGSKGIGAAVVEGLVEQGAKVYFTVRQSKTDAEVLLKKLKLPLDRAIVCDVKNAQSVDDCVDQILSKEERIDILVNNAGIIKDGLFLTLSDEDWQDVLETNLGGVYRFCKVAARPMVSQRQGAIINLSSIVGELGGVGQTNYAASKGAINAFTKSLASELASKNVTVNAVSPGMVETQMSEAARSAFGDKIKERIPLGRFALPQEIADMVCFLASEKARYITGQIFTVDGGISLLGRK